MSQTRAVANPSAGKRPHSRAINRLNRKVNEKRALAEAEIYSRAAARHLKGAASLEIYMN